MMIKSMTKRKSMINNKKAMKKADAANFYQRKEIGTSIIAKIMKDPFRKTQRDSCLKKVWKYGASLMLLWNLIWTLMVIQMLKSNWKSKKR